MTGVQVFLMAFGAVIAVIGVVVFFLLAWFKEATGQEHLNAINAIKILQAEFRFSNPALVIFAGGLLLMVAPFFFGQTPTNAQLPEDAPPQTPLVQATATLAPPTAELDPPTAVPAVVDLSPTSTPTPTTMPTFTPTPPPTATPTPPPTNTPTLAPRATPTMELSYSLRVSASPHRSNPVSLQSRVAYGEVYIFVTPGQGVERVRFFLDNAFVKEEVGAPYDFLGTQEDGAALSLNTRHIGNGNHTIRAEIIKSNDSLLAISATFQVANYDLLVSASPNRVSPTPLQGKTPAGNIYVFISPDQGVERVRFFLNNSLVRDEAGAPYDFMGTDADGAAVPFDTRQLVNGPHSIQAQVVLAGGRVSLATSATFTVSN